jgi:hypothetical protein
VDRGTAKRIYPFGVLMRTPDGQQAEFDASAAQRRWRSPGTIDTEWTRTPFGDGPGIPGIIVD